MSHREWLGSSWAEQIEALLCQGRCLSAAECKAGRVLPTYCDEVTGVFANTGDTGAYALDLFVRATLQSRFPLINCTKQDGECVIAVAEVTDFTDTVVSAPISFAETALTSHYTGAQIAAVDRAATTLGVSEAEVQHLGTWALAWVLAIAHAGHITPPPDKGDVRVTTDWPPSEFSAISAVAAAHGTTLAEFQKTGALFLAYEVAISGAHPDPNDR